MQEEKFKLTVEQVARLTHNLNKDFCWLLGDYSQPPFDEAPDWQIDSAVKGIEFRIANPDVTPAQMHENWMKQKVDEGWVYGPVKCSERKSHPCLIPYDQLGPEQQLKDYLFRAVVSAVIQAGALEGV